MRLHIFSDLHLEFAPLEPPDTGADVVILAGDIHLQTRGVGWAAETFRRPVIYVPGNHEYYGGPLQEHAGQDERPWRRHARARPGLRRGRDRRRALPRRNPVDRLLRYRQPGAGRARGEAAHDRLPPHPRGELPAPAPFRRRGGPPRRGDFPARRSWPSPSRARPWW